MKESSVVKNILTGIAMGIAEVIPGVSGGTIAFITGIYERLLAAIKSLSPSLITTFKEEGVKGVWEKIDGVFLAQLFIGMAFGIVFGIFVITYILENYPLLLWSFFFGLIIASSVYVAQQITKWRAVEIILMILGIGLSYWITITTPANGTTELPFVFLSGMLAISALLLPGLSGSFILLLLGMYNVIIPAVKETLKLNFEKLSITIVFALGCLTGVALFSNFLSWMFNNYKNQTLAVLTGFMIGSLNKVWPWQQVLSVKQSSSGEIKPEFTKSVSPEFFDNLTEHTSFYGTEPQVGFCVLLMVVGFISVFGIGMISKKER